jgi:hypothetical protein
VLSFDDNGYTFSLERRVQDIGKLRGKPLLYLGTAGQNLQRPDYLADAHYTAFRQITYMGGAKEGHQVMLAHGVKGNILEHHEVMLVFGNGHLEFLSRVPGHAGEHFTVHFGHPLRGIFQALSGGVFPNKSKNVLYGGFNSSLSDHESP